MAAGLSQDHIYFPHSPAPPVFDDLPSVDLCKVCQRGRQLTEVAGSEDGNGRGGKRKDDDEDNSKPKPTTPRRSERLQNKSKVDKAGKQRTATGSGTRQIEAITSSGPKKK